MTIFAAPAETFEAVADGFDSGLAGTIGVRVIDNQGATTIDRVTDPVTEYPAGSGIYQATLTAPAVGGQYTVVWDTGVVSPTTVATEDLLVSASAPVLAAPSGRDLCTLADVTSIVPGYQADEETDTLLQRFISSESALIPAEAGREVVGPDSPEPRRFQVDERLYLTGLIQIGDLSTLENTTVEILNADGTVARTLDSSDVIGLYQYREYQRDPWEPVTALRFAAAAGSLGYRTRLQVTGHWGFPSIPPYIREACAKRVILRYVTDVASAGTNLAESIDNLNLAAMFASARDAIDELRGIQVLAQ